LPAAGRQKAAASNIRLRRVLIPSIKPHCIVYFNMIFISGSTGYMGRALAEALVTRGQPVRALVRPGSERKLPTGVAAVPGNALDSMSFGAAVAPADTYVHLVGVAHPAPWKERQFREIDYVSLKASVEAAKGAGVRHFVYVSVAHPAPVMKAYIRIRMECEEILRSSGIPATILRPWYVLGPGHRWPALLLPFYKLAESFSATRDSALRLGLVTIDQMIAALIWAVEHPTDRERVMDVPTIRRAPSAN
jgi:uncharacterized protein YbjT (DUF2867 family)